VRDDTGALQAWIDVGVPDAERVHRAAKAAPRVAVYTHKDPAQLRRALTGARIHRAEHLVLTALPRELVDGLARGLDRRQTWSVSVSGGHLFVSTGTGAQARTVDGELAAVSLQD
jgi:uncharacterized protein YaeQ